MKINAMIKEKIKKSLLRGPFLYFRTLSRSRKYYNKYSKLISGQASLKDIEVLTKKMVLDISWKTIFKIVLTSFSFYLLFLLRDILVLVVFSLIISILFNPAIEFLQRYKIPRVLAVVLV